MVQPISQILDDFFVGNVYFREKQSVGKANLGLRFFRFVECSCTVDCINDGNDAVNHVFFADSFIHKEGLSNRTRIGYAGSFNDDSVKVGFASFSSFSEFD